MDSHVLAKGARWLIDRQFKHASVLVDYRHHGQVFPIHVLVGGGGAESLVDGDVSIDFKRRDFLILASSLAFEPETGDRILYNGVTHEVLSLGSGGCWRWSDDYHILRRVHTKEI